MLSNILKLSVRSLWKNKGIAAINIFGLSIGLACFSLFLLYGLNEFSFDRFHVKADRLYQIYMQNAGADGNESEKRNYHPMLLGPALKADLPDVEQFSRIQGLGETFVRSPKGVLNELVGFTDPAFFEMFSFPILYGNASTPLGEANNVVLTKTMAQKLFGEDNPTGKVLEIKVENDFEPFTVSAVTEDVPTNSSVRFGILLPLKNSAPPKMAGSARKAGTARPCKLLWNCAKAQG